MQTLARATHTFTTITKLILATLLALLLNACGGGGSGSTTTPGNNSSTVQVVNNTPTAITAAHWNDTRVVSTSKNPSIHLEIIGNQLVISVDSISISKTDHLQVYLDTDNNPKTGFQFDGEAWTFSGVDYIVEDGDMFESIETSVNWSWKVEINNTDYIATANGAQIRINLNKIKGICHILNAGVMVRNKHWDIKTFHPASTHMQAFKLDHCDNTNNDTTPPQLTLNGSNPMKIALNSVFTDPGATAIDNTDGDISDQIRAIANVNTAKPGTYKVTYTITDSYNNTAKATRKVIVSGSTPEGIVIDGNDSDWSNIAALVSSAEGIIKVHDDADWLYILVSSYTLNANTQVFIDTDNNPATGFKLGKHVTYWDAGADYMIENHSMEEARGNSAAWTWDQVVANVNTARKGDNLEIALKKTDFEYLAAKLPIAFISRDKDWTLNYLIPKDVIPVYSLKVPGVYNPLSAKDDSATTTQTQPVTVDVLANDSGPTNTSITIKSVGTPLNGKAVISQGKIKYTAKAGFTGTDKFKYTISDGNNHTASATVRVTVNGPMNQAPKAANDSANTTTGKKVTIAALANDSDPDGDSLTIASFTQPANGSVNKANDKLVYQANSGYTGTDSFGYTIKDGKGGTDSATVTVTVTKPASNNPPDAVEDVADVEYNKTVTVNVLANDYDPDGDTLTVESIQQPAFGSAVLNSNGTITVNPQNNVGSMSIFYTLSDGRGGSDIATLTVASTDPNDGNDAYPDITDEEVTTPVNTPIFIDVLANDSDADGDVLVLDQVDQGQHGTTVKVNGGVRYTPNPGYTGTDVFYYGVHDGHGHNGSGKVTVTISP